MPGPCRGFTSAQADAAPRWLTHTKDGMHWITLDTRRDESFPGGLKFFVVHNVAAYRHYRLNITANDGGGGIQLAELDLFAYSSVPPPDAPHRQQN